MTRYFYTDPLAAAWMAKHFGMEFTVTHNGPGCLGKHPLGETPILEHRPPFYIHPDSLPLLGPQVGDLAILPADHEHSDATRIMEDNIRWVAEVGAKIIQRDGKAFHWPESEDGGANG